MTENLSKFLTEARACLAEEQFWADVAAGRVPAHVAALRIRIVKTDSGVHAFPHGFHDPVDWHEYYTSEKFAADRKERANAICLGKLYGEDSS